MSISAVYDISPFTLLDFPDRTACIIWMSGCNMRCPYCYNPDIIQSKGRMSTQSVRSFLDSRAGKLEGVVFSGGECTLHAKLLDELLGYAKNQGYQTKVDTNGSRPEVLQKLLQKEVIDYVAMDFKAPEYLSSQITGNKHSFSNFRKSLQILNDAEIAFEVRTTVHQGLLSQSDLKSMGEQLIRWNYQNTWYLQSFLQTNHTLAKLADSPKLDPLYKDNLFNDSEIKIQIRNT